MPDITDIKGNCNWCDEEITYKINKNGNFYYYCKNRQCCGQGRVSKAQMHKILGENSNANTTTEEQSEPIQQHEHDATSIEDRDSGGATEPAKPDYGGDNTFGFF